MRNFFVDRFNEIKHEIAYNPKWCSDDGYFERVCYIPEFMVLAESFKTVDQDNRKIIIVPSLFGNVVVFQRYSDSDLVTSCVPPRIRELARPIEVCGCLDTTAQQFLLGDKDFPDIGNRIRLLTTPYVSSKG